MGRPQHGQPAPVYAKCIAGKQEEAKRRILEATQPDQDEADDRSDDGADEDNGGNRPTLAVAHAWPMARPAISPDLRTYWAQPAA